MTNAMTTTSAIQTAGKAKSKLSPRRKAYEIGMRTLLYVSAGATCLLLLFLIGYIFVEGMPNLTWEFLTTEESVLNDTVGILPAIQNTVYVVVVTLLFALPLGVGAAIYLTEYATNRKLVTAIEFATETLGRHPFDPVRPGGYAGVLPADEAGHHSAGRLAHLGDYDPAHHHPNHPRVSEDGPTGLPGGRAWPGRR